MANDFVPILFILVGFFLHFGESIHCWECNSKYDPNCGEPFKPYSMALVDCGQRFLKQDLATSATICRKLSQKVQGETRIIRSCGYIDPQEAGTCYNKAGTHLVFTEYCQCSGDGCNKTGALRPLSGFLIVLSLMALMGCFLS
ncbi:uncharacterized protein LOC129227371 [Uloborus diversus]|uniref:uncharacterized protein LOC129227371 n=1 Tax=Uloborus diversus TaxID=327109 RepID=UPI00240952D7|nr:uncharacterized protein LOC129227371 [Uloborus diversus]